MIKLHSKKYLFFSVLLFLVLSTICFIVFVHSVFYHKDEKIKQLQVAGSLAEKEFQKTIQNNIISLESLKERLAESEGEFIKYLENDSYRIIRQNPALKFIEYIDSSGVIRKVTPLAGNEAIVNLDIKKIAYRYPSWQENTKDTLTNITPWVDLTQKGKAFLVDVPLYYNNRFQGTITAGMDFQSQFDDISSKLDDYSIQIKDDVGTTFYAYNNPLPEMYKDPMVFKAPLIPTKARQNVWMFQFMFKKGTVVLATESQKVAMVIGLVFSAIISLLAYFYLLAKQQSHKFEKAIKRLEILNTDLDAEKNRAQEASEAKTQFLSNMSHEIRTPLSAILSISEILEGQKLSPEEHEYIHLMRHSSKTLLKLVNNILNFDKIESGEIEFSQEPFQPKALLKKTIDTYSHNIVKKEVRIIGNLDSTTPAISAIGDSSAMEQIYINLISNAIKFTERGTIEITYREIPVADFLEIHFEIADSGIGIPESKLEVIFERFSQLDQVVTKKHQGSGLGLAITKKLVNLLNGSITVSSKLGEGTTFSVKLNLPLEAQITSDTEVQNSKSDYGHLKVLVVDDNILNQLILVKILSKKNIVADTASTGDEALDNCNQKQYDLIFMDVHMPDKDGFEVVKQIRKTDTESIILGLSADVTKHAIEYGISIGMNDYLTKPIEQKNLFATLDKYFG